MSLPTGWDFSSLPAKPFRVLGQRGADLCPCHHPHPGQNPGQKTGLETQISSVQHVLKAPKSLRRASNRSEEPQGGVSVGCTSGGLPWGPPETPLCPWQTQRLRTILEQRDRMIKQGKYTPPEHHMGKEEPRP